MNIDDNNEKTVDPFEKHLDIAIEAQDGKTENTEAADTKSESNKEDSEKKQPEDSKSGAEDDAAQQHTENKAGEADKKPVAGPKDLTLQDGSVVRAGAERRFYEGRELARQQLSTAQNELRDITTKYADLEKRFNDLDANVKGIHGVDANTLRLGVNIVRDLQKDPPGTLRKLLAEAVAQGYTVEGIGEGVDIAALEERLIARLGNNNNNNEPSDADIEREAINEANTFFKTYPDAVPHDALLARMLRDHPGLTLQSAYFQLKDAFIEKGFDWSRSLEDNVKGGANDPANQNSQQEQDQQNKAPLPNGNNAANADIKTADVVGLGADDMDTGDIVKQAMREAGLNI